MHHAFNGTCVDELNRNSSVLTAMHCTFMRCGAVYEWVCVSATLEGRFGGRRHLSYVRQTFISFNDKMEFRQSSFYCWLDWVIEGYWFFVVCGQLVELLQVILDLVGGQHCILTLNNFHAHAILKAMLSFLQPIWTRTAWSACHHITLIQRNRSHSESLLILLS